MAGVGLRERERERERERPERFAPSPPPCQGTRDPQRHAPQRGLRYHHRGRQRIGFAYLPAASPQASPCQL
jgi:hypothetical protein